MATATLNCPHCKTTKATFDIVHTAPHRRQRGHQCAFSRCRTCDNFIMIDLYRRSGAPAVETMMASDADVNSLNYAITAVAPEDPKDIPDYLPENISSEYESALRAYMQKSWSLAAIGFRRVLDISTRTLDPSFGDLTLTERLERLLAGGVVTSPLREWLRQADWPRRPPPEEIEQYSQADASHLRYFCEGYLKYIYELPGAISDRRERASSERLPQT